MNKITENLYLSDYEYVKSLPKNSRKYSLIISLYKSPSYPKLTHIPVMFIDIEDSEKDNISQYFKYTYDLIDGCYSRNEKVLIHCRAGVSRSASIVIAFIMKKYNISMEEAYDFVKNKRSIIDPNYGFIKQLNKYK